VLSPHRDIQTISALEAGTISAAEASRHTGLSQAELTAARCRLADGAYLALRAWLIRLHRTRARTSVNTAPGCDVGTDR
jgi:hypothetical protein